MLTGEKLHFVSAKIDIFWLALTASSNEELTIQDGIELPVDYNWSLAMSSRPGLPLKLSTTEHPNAIFEVSVEGGTLLLWNTNQISYMKSPFEVENDTTIYWTNLSQTSENNFEQYRESEAYINIVIREEENIVGYAVVQIYTSDLENEPVQTYHARLLKSVSFPIVNAAYQKITSEYIQSEMEQVRNGTLNVKQDEDVTADTAPTIILNGQKYVAPHMPVNELPDGYEYIGNLSEEAAYTTGLAGCKVYANTSLDSLSDVYIYQECGTPVSKDTVDGRLRQWAYVQWVLDEFPGIN